MARTVNMTRGQPMKLLFTFALPLMLGNVFQQLYTVTDTAIIGQGVGMDALAALGTVDWMNWLPLGMAQGFTQGFSVRISQKYGEGDEEGLREMIGQSILLSVVMAAVITLAGMVGLPFFMRLLHVPEALSDMAALYTRILLGGFTVVMFYNLCSSILRAVGDSRTPLVAMVIASAANILLDALAVFVLNWGIAGAAGATILAQCLAGGICVRQILRSPLLRIHREQLRLRPGRCRELAGIGSSIAAKNLIIALGGMVVQSIVNGFGTAFIAGFTATSKLYGILEIAAFSYGYAVTTYVGQNYGAADYERIRKGVRSALLLALVTAVGVSAVMIGFGRQITGLFIASEDPALLRSAWDTAYHFLCTMASCLPILYLLYVYQSALQGIGDTVAPMVSGTVELAVRVSVAFLVARIGVEEGIFAAEVLAWAGAWLYLMLTYYRRARRLTSP